MNTTKTILTSLVLVAVAGTTMASAGVGSTTYGIDNTVSGKYSNAFGYKNTASGENSIAAGVSSTASGKDTVAVGHNAVAGDYDSIAIGKNAQAPRAGTVVIGRNAKSDAELSLAVGTETESVWGGTAVGVLAKATGTQSTALGNGANATNLYATAVGVGAKATGVSATVVGISKATGNHSIAVGYAAESAGKQSIAVGTTAAASGVKSIAIGSNNKAEGEASINIGSDNYGASAHTTIVGSNNTIDHTDHMVDPEGDVVIGTGNSMQDAYYGVVVGKNSQLNNADNAVVVGNDASVTVSESVAIGHNSKANSVVSTASASIANKAYNFAGGTALGTVSVGDTGKERTITNVAAGRISDTSTDAVNGSQLHAVATEVAKNKQNVKDLAIAVNDLGDIVKDNSDAIADNKTAIANAMTEASKHSSVVGDDEQNIRVTPTTKSDGSTEYKVELNHTLNEMNAINFGDHANGTIIERGSFQINNSDNDSTTYLYAGTGTFDNKNASVAINQNINGIQDAINIRSMTDPDSQVAINSDGIVIKDDTTYETKMSFSTVQGIHAGNHQINELAAGTKDTDAVNLSQLKEVERKITTAGADVLGNAKSYTDKEVSKVGAASAALAALHPLDYNPDHKLDVMAGYGHFRDANSAAIGVAYRPNEDLMFTVGTTFGADNVINAGISYKVGAKTEVSRSKVAMATDLEAANKEIAQLKADNEKIKAILEKVLGEQAADLK